MRLLHRLAPLSLCAVLLLGMIGPVYAEEAASPGRVYRALDDSPYQVFFHRDIDFGIITRNIAEDDFYWGDGTWDYDTFALLWDEAAFNAHLERGETEFTLTGEYGLSEGSSSELVELWNAGLVTMPDPPKLLVHIRPRDDITVYSIQDEEIVWKVRRSTPFEEAALGYDTVTLRPKEGDNPYHDRIREDFYVAWSQEEYEAGIDSGAETFTISGIYGEPEWDEMKGWAKAEGTAEATVVVEEETAGPLVYRDPLVDLTGGINCAAYVTPATAFDELRLPAEATLRLVGGTYQDTRRFSYEWSREEYTAGLAAGGETFTLTGGYAPHALWTSEEQQWWADGRIQVDMPTPTLTVHVLREETFSFTASVRINHYGDLGPHFAFPWVAGMDKAVLAYSLDNETWYEDVWTWDDLPSDQRLRGEIALTLLAEDPHGNPMINQDTPVVYVKMTVVGSSLAGTSGIYDLKPSAQGWDMTPHDDNGGDHGGGGQGQHDRPGKDDANDKPVPSPAPNPEPEEPSESGGAFKPTPNWPDQVVRAWAHVTNSAISMLAPQEEPDREHPPMQEEPGLSPTDDGEETSLSGKAPAPQPRQEPTMSQSEGTFKEGDWAPEPQSPPQMGEKPAAEMPEQPASVSQETDVHVPGFAVAAAVTIALILCGAVWFHWRGKHH